MSGKMAASLAEYLAKLMVDLSLVFSYSILLSGAGCLSSLGYEQSMRVFCRLCRGGKHNKIIASFFFRAGFNERIVAF